MLFLGELGTVGHHENVRDEDQGQNKCSLLIADVEVAAQVRSNRADHILTSEELFEQLRNVRMISNFQI